MGKHLRSILIFVLVLIAIIFFVDKLLLNQQQATKLSYSQFYSNLEANNVNQVTISGRDIAGELRHATSPTGDAKFTTSAPEDSTLLPELHKRNFDITSDYP